MAKGLVVIGESKLISGGTCHLSPKFKPTIGKKKRRGDNHKSQAQHDGTGASGSWN
jgi:hypothetical protein